MNAARLHAIGEKLRIDEVPIPKPVCDEVLVKMKAAGICGSDLHIVDGHTKLGRYPLTLGHENAGVIEEIGSNVQGWKIGDRVCVNYLVTCGQCRFCLTGRPTLCIYRQGIGVHRDGGFADYLIAPSRNLIKLPENVPYELGAIITDAVATPYHAITKRSGLKLGDTVAVYGVGGLGFNAIKLLRLAGASTIIAVDPSPAALNRALDVGADVAINPQVEKPSDMIKSLTKFGVDIAFEFVGREETIHQAAESVRPGGRAVLVGLGAPKIELMAPGVFVRNEIEVVGSFNFETTEIQELVGLASSNKIDLSGSVTSTLGLVEINEYLKILREKRASVVRSVVVFD